LVLESQVSLISETSFRMHNRVLDMIFPFSNKVLLNFFSGSISMLLKTQFPARSLDPLDDLSRALEFTTQF
jgi:hypothetical protein